MNINVVKNMFGEMTQPPVLSEKKGFLIPVVVTVIACVVSFLIYKEMQRQKEDKGIF